MKLSEKTLKMYSPGQIFASGQIVDSNEGITIFGSGKQLRWVAVKGMIDDWSIYVHFSQYNDEFVKNYGMKVIQEENIKKLIECDEYSFKAYRY